MSKPIRKYLKLPRKDRVLLVKTMILLGLMRVAIQFFSFQCLCHWLKLVPGEVEGIAATETVTPSVSHISWAIRTAAPHTPWQNTCLTQALAGVPLLRWQRLPAVLTLGIAKNSTHTAGYAAHAWLHSNGMLVTGGELTGQYQPLSAFYAIPDKQ